MLETQVEMKPEVARKHYLAYRALKDKQRSAEDDEMQRSYLELSRGHAIINAQVAIEAAGLGPDKRPRLAFCPADARRCHIEVGDGRVIFGVEGESYRVSSRRLFLRCPGTTWMTPNATAPVPVIPPAHRPDRAALSRYWLMWEVGENGWTSIPDDPALLRRLNATTFAVVAVWDLTPVEQMVLRGRA